VNPLRKAATELFGLFVEDRVFALAIALWLAFCGALASLHAGSGHVRALALFVGLSLILIASVARAARVP
jgi:hypothetical protein